ncbi:MAG: methyltransferase domain-containing protein [Syntrophomonadaceae bacterium]
MNDSREEIRKLFNDVAGAYDSQRRYLIPCFDDFYGTAVALAQADTPEPAILDIGAGTGLMSALLLKKYPGASLTLIDVSDQMVEMARQRFQNASDIEYIIDDFARHRFSKSFDIIISSLAIHHLNEAEKEALYHKVYHTLEKPGCFINADQVLGSTVYMENLYKEDWKQKVLASPLTSEELDQAYERTRMDQMSTLRDQLGWMKDAGFSEVDCVYKYYNFVVLYARKQ